MKISKLKRLDSDLIDRWYDTVEDSEQLLDFAEGMNINEFGIVYGDEDNVCYILFENGNNYTVDTVMLETDGDKQARIITALGECGISFDEVEGVEL